MAAGTSSALKWSIMTLAIAISGQRQRQAPDAEHDAEQDLERKQRGRRNIQRLPLDDRRQHVAFQRVHAEEQDEGGEGRDPSRGEACQHHDQPAEDRADRRDEGEQSGLNAQDERTLDADDRKADPGHEETPRPW